MFDRKKTTKINLKTVLNTIKNEVEDKISLLEKYYSEKKEIDLDSEKEEINLDGVMPLFLPIKTHLETLSKLHYATGEDCDNYCSLCKYLISKLCVAISKFHDFLHIAMFLDRGLSDILSQTVATVKDFIIESYEREVKRIQGIPPLQAISQAAPVPKPAISSERPNAPEEKKLLSLSYEDENGAVDEDKGIKVILPPTEENLEPKLESKHLSENWQKYSGLPTGSATSAQPGVTVTAPWHYSPPMYVYSYLPHLPVPYSYYSPASPFYEPLPPEYFPTLPPAFNYLPPSPYSLSHSLRPFLPETKPAHSRLLAPNVDILVREINQKSSFTVLPLSVIKDKDMLEFSKAVKDNKIQYNRPMPIKEKILIECGDKFSMADMIKFIKALKNLSANKIELIRPKTNHIIALADNLCSDPDTIISFPLEIDFTDIQFPINDQTLEAIIVISFLSENKAL